MNVSCKKFNMLLCSHSKGLRKQGPGEQSHLENCKVWIFPCGRFIPCRVFRSSGYPLPFQNMGLLSEQLVRPNPRWPNITGIIPKNVGEVAGMVYLDNRIQAVPRTTQQELLQQGQSYCCRAWKTPRSELATINKLQRNKCLMGLEPQRRKKPYLVTIVAILHKAGRLVVPGET